MRRLIVFNLVTLDGCFEGSKPWDIQWHEEVWDEGLEQLSRKHARTTGMLLFGRVTYEGMAAYWPGATGDVADFMNSVPKIVASHTLGTASWNNSRIVSDDVVDTVSSLKRESGGDIRVFGSALLTATLLEVGLVDEICLAVAPLILGSGRALFPARLTRCRMHLLETRALESGCVILRYQPIKE